MFVCVILNIVLLKLLLCGYKVESFLIFYYMLFIICLELKLSFCMLFVIYGEVLIFELIYIGFMIIKY